ncbi:integral membrane protein [Catenulispora acidiphila DSM 44928]|uniref:Integral membrane protein n=1 Tax=Catenulispora acidiphila (strain DSM 44928 / JCM 14897 / NBRC 102108 / NRRL B-24433 / ID139908) TaxID=479433 RepID=C7QAC0_CATAD|nr:DMT family transporter [Catenulispora acidiphila]ACU72419.1 integral membrane protein [Catenulispora acidiphila DSM 44928]
MSIALAVTAALLAAMAFAVAAVLQQAAAASVPESKSLHPSLFVSLVRRPAWVAGAVLDVASYVIQGVALAFGPLVLVMPLASTDLVFALPLLAWRGGRRLTRAEVAGAACTAGGMAAFLVALPSVSGMATPGLADWIPLLAVVVVLAGVLLAIGIRVSGNIRTGLYAAAAGLLLALLDALTKSAADLFRNDGLAALGHWEPYALIAVGGSGLLLVQSSYQAGSLAISLPVIDTVEPVGSVLMGAVVFQEPLATSWALAGQVAAGALAVAGIVILSRSTLVQAAA